MVDFVVGHAELVDVRLVRRRARDFDFVTSPKGLYQEPLFGQKGVRLHAPVHVAGADHRDLQVVHRRHRSERVLAAFRPKFKDFRRIRPFHE